MNVVSLIGRWTRDIELRYSQSGEAVAKATLAVDNPYKKDNASFIRIVMFKKTAENTAQYTNKGSKVAVEGYIQTGSYENKDGQKVYTTEVIANRVTFLDSPKDGGQGGQSGQDYGGFGEGDPPF